MTGSKNDLVKIWKKVLWLFKFLFWTLILQSSDYVHFDSVLLLFFPPTVCVHVFVCLKQRININVDKKKFFYIHDIFRLRLLYFISPTVHLNQVLINLRNWEYITVWDKLDKMFLFHQAASTFFSPKFLRPWVFSVQCICFQSVFGGFSSVSNFENQPAF